MARNVGVNFIFEDEPYSINVPRGTSCAEVQDRWSEISLESQEFRLTLEDPDGEEFPSEGVVDQLLRKKVPVLTVYVSKKSEIRVTVIGAADISLNINVHPQMSVDDLIAIIKSRLNISADRQACLRYGERILDGQRPILSQIEGSDHVHLDIQLRILVYEMTALQFEPIVYIGNDEAILNRDLPDEVVADMFHVNDRYAAVPMFDKKMVVRTVTCWASDCCNALFPSTGTTRNIRVKSRATESEVDENTPVLALLGASNIVEEELAMVEVEQKIPISVNDEIRQKCVKTSAWPSEQLSKFLSGEHEKIFIDGREVSGSMTLWTAGIQPNAIITVTRSITLQIICSDGVRRRVRADPNETLHDLHQRVEQLEGDSRFRLQLNCQPLPYDWRSLMEHKIKEKSLLNVVYKTRDVRLVMNGEEPQLLEKVKNKTTCDEFIELAGKCLNRQLPNDTQFTCECGRVLSNENSVRRIFSYKCCYNPMPKLTIDIPQMQRYEGHTVSSSFYAPETRLLKGVLKNIKTLSGCSSERIRQKTEAALVKGSLLLAKARMIQTQLDERLHLLVQIGRERERIALRPTASMYELLTDIEKRTDRRVSDFALSRDHHLHVRDDKKKTFLAAGLEENMLIGVVFHQMRRAISQTGGPLTAENKVAKFLIVWWFNKGMDFNLDVPFQPAGLKVSQLRLAVSAQRGIKAPNIRLLQRGRGRRRKDGTPVVRIEGGVIFGYWATAAGEEVDDDEVEAEEWNVELQDDEFLLVPGEHRSEIYVPPKRSAPSLPRRPDEPRKFRSKTAPEKH